LVNAGELDRRIVLLRPSDRAQAADGEPVSDMVEEGRVWAAVEAVAGGEPYGAHQRAAQAGVVFRVRWRAAVSPLNQILYDGRRYDIERVVEIGRREGLELHATVRTEGP
jgi:SPP1 family predicted phage head-tail adaptor